MKAIVYHNYGSPDVLKCEEIEKPLPKDDEVLIRVRAASVNPLDLVFRGTPYLIRIMTGLRKPKNKGLGVDVAGQIEAVGGNVKQFNTGDQVFGACRGAFAEYACARESRLALKPDNVTFEQAASVPVAAITALQGLRDKGKICAGQKVLINGAAGGVGTFAVQIAKSFGAEVTGVCSTKNVGMVRSIGADRVIDYTQADFTRGGQLYELIFDLVGNHSFSERRRVLTPNGICVMAGLGGAGLHPESWGRLAGNLKAALWSQFVRQKFVMLMARVNKEDFDILSDLMQSGKVIPVIDKRYKLNEVAEAARYLEAGHARGKVVVALDM